MKDYQAALTLKLVTNLIQVNEENIISKSTTANIRSTTISYTGGPSYASVAKLLPSNSNILLFKKLDHMLERVEEESKATRHAVKELKEEMQQCNEETKKQMEEIDSKVKILESNYADLSLRFYTVMENICIYILDPQYARSADWKSYWEELIKKAREFRKSRVKGTI